MEWKIRTGDEEYRAESIEELRSWYREGRIPPSANIYHPLQQKWMYPSDVRELFDSDPLLANLPASTDSPAVSPVSPGESSSEVESSEAEDWPSRFPFSPTAAGAGALIVLAVLLMIFRNAAPEQRGSSSANSVVAQQPNVVQDDRRAQPLKERQQNLAAARAHIQSTDLTAARESLSLVAEVDPDNPNFNSSDRNWRRPRRSSATRGRRRRSRSSWRRYGRSPGATFGKIFGSTNSSQTWYPSTKATERRRSFTRRRSERSKHESRGIPRRKRGSFTRGFCARTTWTEDRHRSHNGRRSVGSTDAEICSVQ